MFFLCFNIFTVYSGPFKCYIMQCGVGGVRFPGKKCHEYVRFNVISVTRWCVGVEFPEFFLCNT